MAKELSIFIDESGDFGEYNFHSPYYIVTLVLHNQENNITNNIKVLDDKLKMIGYDKNWIHVGPIIRKEEDDNGQIEVTKMFSNIFNTLFSNVIINKVIPSKYKLFQVADLYCYFKLLSLKINNKSITNNELYFF